MGNWPTIYVLRLACHDNIFLSKSDLSCRNCIEYVHTQYYPFRRKNVNMSNKNSVIVCVMIGCLGCLVIAPSVSVAFIIDLTIGDINILLVFLFF